jgi:hypothetical protein
MTVFRRVSHGFLLPLGLVMGLLGASCSPENRSTVPEKQVQDLSTEPIFVGSVAVGEDTCEREVTVKNLSTEKFELQRVESSCGCMVPAFKPITLSPGEDLKLRMQLIPGAVRGLRQANILIAGANAKVIKVPVSAWFEPESGFMLDKGPATLTVSGQKEPATVNFRVYAQNALEDHFVVSCDRESVQLHSERSEIGNADGGVGNLVQLKYTAKLSPQLLEECRKASFTVRRKDAAQFVATYEVTWINDHSTFAAEPGELFISAPGETRSTWVSTGPDVDLRLASKAEFLRCSLERETVVGTATPRWLLTVASDLESPKGFHQHVLRIEAVGQSDGEVRGGLEIPCSYVNLSGK